MCPSICNSFPVIRTASAKNCHFHVPQPTFLFPLETPLRLSRNMLHGWKDNSVLTKPLAACTHLSATVSHLFKLQVQKIAIFTYCSPHFCFPCRRPCDYHAICCMDGKPNPSQHVPIFNSFRVIRCLSQCVSKNLYFLPHFGFPWGRPWGNHAKCCMDEKRI